MTRMFQILLCEDLTHYVRDKKVGKVCLPRHFVGCIIQQTVGIINYLAVSTGKWLRWKCHKIRMDKQRGHKDNNTGKK